MAFKIRRGAPIPWGSPPGQTGMPESEGDESAHDVAEELSKLADLRDRGVLTQDEFDAQKQRLLGA